jgi:hypothetical protein
MEWNILPLKHQSVTSTQQCRFLTSRRFGVEIWGAKGATGAHAGAKSMQFRKMESYSRKKGRPQPPLFLHFGTTLDDNEVKTAS